MRTKRRLRLIREGRYLAEVEVDSIEPADGWSPLLRLEDAYRLDEVRRSLRQGDLERAATFGQVYTLTPLSPSRE